MISKESAASGSKVSGSSGGFSGEKIAAVLYPHTPGSKTTSATDTRSNGKCCSNRGSSSSATECTVENLLKINTNSWSECRGCDEGMFLHRLKGHLKKEMHVGRQREMLIQNVTFGYEQSEAVERCFKMQRAEILVNELCTDESHPGWPELSAFRATLGLPVHDKRSNVSAEMAGDSDDESMIVRFARFKLKRRIDSPGEVFEPTTKLPCPVQGCKQTRDESRLPRHARRCLQMSYKLRGLSGREGAGQGGVVLENRARAVRRVRSCARMQRSRNAGDLCA
jgi:hypothetical protein